MGKGGAKASFHVIYQKQVRVFHQVFQTQKKYCFFFNNFITITEYIHTKLTIYITLLNNEFVSRCLEPPMKHEARVFDMASQMKQLKIMQ